MSMLSRFAATGGGITDPYWSNVSLLLVGNGANGTTTNIVDSSNNHLATTITSPVAISTTQSKYGSGSVYVPGSGSISIPANAGFSFGTGDFTFEAWVYLNSTGTQGIIDTRSGPDYSNYIWVFETGPKLSFWLSGTSNKTTNNIPTSQWVYIATVRASGVIKHYINGVVDNATGFSVSSAINASNSTLYYIGRLFDSSGLYLNAYIYDLRVTKGVARYTTNFTPPTAPLPIG
ncbi:MAG: LamG domain-containing protein [Fluviibacter sp.]